MANVHRTSRPNTKARAISNVINTIASALYKERKRLWFVFVLAFFSGTVFYRQFHGIVLGLPAPLFMGLLYGVALTLAAVVVCLFLPSLKYMIDGMSVARVLVAFATLASPRLAEYLIGSPFVMATLVIVVGIPLIRVLHGPVVKRTRSNRERVRVAVTPWQRGFTRWIENRTPVSA